MNAQGELVAILGDACSMFSKNRIPDPLKALLEKRRFHHMLVTGNMGTGDSLAYLQTVCDDIHMISGLLDSNSETPFQKTISIAGYTILLLNGAASMVGISDMLLLSSAKINHADICVYGNTFDASVQSKDGILFVNPGSVSGAFHPYHPDNKPSFVLLSLKEKEVEVFVYQICDEKLEVAKGSFKRNE
ncbi:hypothetical protein WA577_001502 [Blastocystis sp. JDR]